MNEALVLLVLLWAVLLVPGALRSRNSSPHATVGGFERAMDVLRSEGRGPGTGRRLLVPGDAGRIVGREVDPTVRSTSLRAEDPVVARRRTWFVRSVGLTLSFLVLAVTIGGWLWVPTVLSLLGTGAYVALLRSLKLQRDQARRVVARLDLQRTAAHEPVDRAVGDGLAGAGGGVRLRRWDA